MRRLRTSPLGILALLALPLAMSAQTGQAQEPHAGKALYDQWCSECHGEQGVGDGAAARYMLPRPRDFTKALYQIRTTGSGDLPADADLMRVIEEGMPGTAMPGWRSRLSERERRDVIDYLKTFSRFFQGADPQVLAFGRAPGANADGISEGAEVYQALECFKCHGEAGRGDGTSAPDMTDDDGFPIRPADLTESWTFNGGATVDAIYARLRTGLDGTPMPSFTDAMESGVVTEEQLWRVAQYVRSLSPERLPEVREVVRASLMDTLPVSPDDSAWARVEPFYIPLVGQIIVAPRWFAPSVDGIWVQAAHDGQQLTLLVSWSDPSASPDSTWQPWLDGIARTVAQDDSSGLVHGPDRLAVHFPRTIDLDDAELPYFLGGSTRRPVYSWRWTSGPDGVQDGLGTGLGQFSAAPGTTQVAHTARFAEGRWQVQLNRALVPADTTAAPSFETGIPIPIAFYVADGTNGEDDVRGSVSAWYAIYLDVPTPRGVYVQPVLATILTAGLGIFVVLRAQRRERSVADLQGEKT